MKNENVITLKEALAVFSLKDENGFFLPFDLEYRTFNEQTKKGGKYKKYTAVKYLPNAKNEDSSSKNPNHFFNRTRNIELPNGDIKSIKIDFIISVNNKKVIY